MNSSELQSAIIELAEFSPSPEAEWVAKVDAAPVPVVVGAISHWRRGSGVSGGSDPQASRREAALALLHARLSNQTVAATSALHTSISAYQEVSGRQAARMLGLTWAIAVLTFIMLAGLGVQICIALRPPASGAPATQAEPAVTPPGSVSNAPVKP